METKILVAGVKRQQMEETLKEEIRSGVLKPGETLPTYDRLADRFNASRATFCYVLNNLKKEGYIVTVKRQGTFVAERPPCHHRFGLIFPYPSPNLFWVKMQSEFSAYCRRTGNESVSFYGSGDLLRSKRADWNGLFEELSRGRLAGLLFVAGFNQELFHEIAVTFPKVPIITFYFKESRERNVGHLFLYDTEKIRKVAEYFHLLKVRRAALIGCGSPLNLESFAEQCRSHGIETREEWMLLASESHSKAVPNILRLLFSLPADRRPDGLYITDDNLIDTVQETIIACGISVPRELKLVTHYNFPDYNRPALPMGRVGPDLRSIISQFMTLVENLRMHRGEQEFQVRYINDLEYQKGENKI